MSESRTVIDSWRREGRHEGFAEGMALGMLEARRADMLRVYQLRFHRAAPGEMAAAVRANENLDALSRWLDAAVAAPNEAVFAAMISSMAR